MANETFCTPYISRTIKGWKIRVKICFTVDSATYTVATYQSQANSVSVALGGITNSSWMVGGGFNAEVEQAWATATSDYDNAEDVVAFSFATVEGTLAKISVPNPKDSIFLADKMTVDPTNTSVAAFITALQLGGSTATAFVASSASGALLNTFLGGLRIRRKTRRKLNIWVRNPELSAPGI